MQGYRFAILALAILSACGHRSLAPDVSSSGEVRFYCSAAAQGEVFLIGDFNGWRRGQPMRRQNGYAEADVQLRPGSYGYACMQADGSILSPPEAPAYVDDGFGGRNGWLIVPGDRK